MQGASQRQARNPRNTARYHHYVFEFRLPTNDALDLRILAKRAIERGDVPRGYSVYASATTLVLYPPCIPMQSDPLFTAAAKILTDGRIGRYDTIKHRVDHRAVLVTEFAPQLRQGEFEEIQSGSREPVAG